MIIIIIIIIIIKLKNSHCTYLKTGEQARSKGDAHELRPAEIAVARLGEYKLKNFLIFLAST